MKLPEMQQILFYPNAISLLLKTFLYIFFYLSLLLYIFKPQEVVFPPPRLILPQFSAFHLLFGPNSPGRKADTFSTALHSRAFIPPVSHSGVCARAFVINIHSVYGLKHVWNLILGKISKEFFFCCCLRRKSIFKSHGHYDGFTFFVHIYIYICMLQLFRLFQRIW